MRLSEVQACFAQALRPQATASQVAALQACLVDHDEIPQGAGLAVYRNTVLGGQRNALAGAFPAIRRIVGASCFKALAFEYFCRWPSRDPDWHAYGARMASLLARVVRREPAFADMEYLPDLARFEWACHRAYYADADPAFDWSRLASLSAQRAGDIRLRLARHVALVRSCYPLAALQADAGEAVEPFADPKHWVVRRAGLTVGHEAVAAPTFAALRAIRQGRTLDQLARRGLPVDQLAQWVAGGWVAGAEWPPEPGR